MIDNTTFNEIQNFLLTTSVLNSIVFKGNLTNKKTTAKFEKIKFHKIANKIQIEQFTTTQVFHKSFSIEEFSNFFSENI